MESNLISYRRFISENEALEFSRTLSDSNIFNQLEIIGSNDVAVYTGHFLKEYSVLIHAQDKELVDQITSQRSLLEIENHPFIEYSDDELLEVLFNKGEWNINEVSVASVLVEKRGLEISSQKIDTENGVKLSKIRKPKTGKNWTFVLTIVLSVGFLFTGFAVPGLLCVAAVYAICINYMLLKKELPNGEKLFEYDLQTRKKARTVLIIYSVLFGVYLTSLLGFFFLT
ncbi:hypothetical protein OAH12_01300 [Cyclobacteriaceae bacterium]|nr:hypothetical protein [Cyclobacteriaceae bacterium]